MLKLQVRHQPHQAAWLVEPGVKVGRRVANDLILDHSTVADLHFVVAVRDDRLLLKKRAPESSVLTVNGRPVMNTCALHEGDVIGLDGIELTVVDPKKERYGSVPASAAPSQWKLKANSSALGERIFPIAPTTVVGRSEDCDIHLAVAHLSRRHAQLQVLDGLLYVKDLGSSNGTYLNGRPITEARVRRGDELRFDTLSFGVLGPMDDLDKTTVRSVPLPSGTPRVKMVRRSAAPVSRPPPVPEAVAVVTETAAPPSRWRMAAFSGVGILMMLVALVWWLTGSGLSL